MAEHPKNIMHQSAYNQKGVIIPLFAMFSTMILSLLLFAVDGYVRLQARLDQQNIGEYLSLAALHGFYEPVMDDTDFQERNANLLQALQESQNDNGVMGIWGTSNGWNFSGTSCSCNSCTGNGWSITYGNYQMSGDSFTKVSSMDEEDPNLCDTSLINAIMLEVYVPTGSSFMRFFHKASADESVNIRVSSVSQTYTVGSKRIYRTMKKVAGGDALSTDPDNK